MLVQTVGLWGFPYVSDSEESACNPGDLGTIHGSGRSPGEGNCNLLQYSYLGNPMDRGAWQSIVHGIAKSWTRLSDQITTTESDDTAAKPHSLP